MHGINILLYSGNGTSPNAVRHTQHTLKMLLGHAYDIVSVDAQTLRSEPWEDTCAMVVVPGGRDLPYCNDLNGAANNRIRHYVQGGGRYLGLCAGAYYASKTIEFEKDKELQVLGPRELAFYPGLSRGTIYPGFVYDSEKGACAALVETTSGQTLPMYYNGGGYFAHAEQYQDVKVLARYAEPGICEDEAKPAAAVECKVGQGTAVLIATHPEYDMSDYPSAGELAQKLLPAEKERKAFLRSVFSSMGLKVLQEEAEVPRLTPIHIAGLRPEIAATVANNLQSISKDHIIEDANDIFRLTEDDRDLSLAGLSVNEDDKPLTPHFDLKAYFDALVGHRSQEWGGGKWYRFGNAMLYADVITSTQTVLDKNYTFSQALPDGLVCLATNQIAGRGRGRNSWVSQLGALQFSLLVRHSLQLTKAPVVFIQYIIALSILESIRSRKGYEDIPLRLKWPNDIYAETSEGLKKVGGLLVNSSFAQNEFLLVIGCGVNLSNPQPTVSINDIIQQHGRARLTSEDVLAGILVQFEKYYTQFCEEGMGPWFLDTYYARWLHTDKVVTLTTHDNEQAKIKGITTDYGMLEAVSVADPRKHYTLQPDGNSFDMLKGLIVKKT
ncbi:biotin-protein ligase [Syncephalastrum racemosum]|uniref:Biotin-protein ligase n=1 Tax=Syncephalastrum racemosum TaxID=13706 RepID=A0A1X2H7F9_SYNRA|nr:biotin-protein ligase [Syncephalastrum racemosum]